MPKKQDRTILVTGATGHQGGAVLRRLRERNFPVRALTRNPESPKARALVGHGTELVHGDMDDPGFLLRAMDGVYGVFSVQDPYTAGIDGEIRQGINVADAAKRAGVTHLIYSSVGSADQNTGIPHFESKAHIEKHIQQGGLSYTIVRPVFFMENWLGLRGPIEKGTLPLPLDPSTRLQMVAVDDIGAFVATALEHPGKWLGRIFELAGDELTMAGIAEVISRIAEREVLYTQTPWAEFEKAAGPEVATMWRWFQNQGYHVDIASVRQALPGVTSFEKWAHQALVSAMRAA